MSLARTALARQAPRAAAAATAGPLRIGAVRGFTTAKADSIPVAASSDDGSHTSVVTVAIKAGPRFETQPGLAHVLKNFTFKSNKRRSALALVREAELYGGVLSSSLTKEHLLLTAEFLRGDEEYFVQVLGDVLSSQKYQSHEYNEEVVPQVQSEYEQALNSPNTLGFDTLTQTAYRQRGLGASLFSTPTIPISHSQIVAYAQAAFAKDNIAIVGSGIESSTLTNLVSKYFKEARPSGGNLTAGPNTYYGGDARVPYVPSHESDAPRAHYGHYLLAFQGAGLDASPELAVLRSHLGGESNVKWSAGLSPLSQVADAVPGATASAFNISFTDAGLFGAYVTAPQTKVLDAAKNTMTAIKNSSQSLSKEDLAKAKAKARFEAAAALENRSGVHAAVGGQLLQGGKVQLLDETFAKIEGVSASALASAASKMLSSRPTTVALGDVFKLPYSDEIV